MKVLAPTYVFPDIKHIRTVIFNNIFSSLKNKTNLDVHWVVFQPDEFQSANRHNVSLLDIHDFNDAVSLLKNTRPDCVLITSTPDMVQYALCIAAKHLQIPIFSIYVFDKNHLVNNDGNSIYKAVWRAINIFSANKISTDAPSQQKFFRRGRFIIYKNKFLFNTLYNAGNGLVDSLTVTCKNILTEITGKSKNYNDLANYHFLSDNFWINFLTKAGISKESIFVTGNPYWQNFTDDDLRIKKTNSQDPINLLIVTDSLLVHNYWSENQMKNFINNLISNLLQNTNLNFSFKIHPSSENKQYYSKLFRNYPNQIQIFQSEKLSDILNDFDLVISYGNTTAHTEIIARCKKLILIDLEMNLIPAPLVKEGSLCGLVTICKTTDDIVKIIYDCIDQEIIISDDWTAKRDALFSKNNEPSNQIADIMIEKLRK